MRRREFIALFGASIAWPLVARAQQTGRVPRIGILTGSTATLYTSPNSFIRGLHELGYTEGQNLVDRARLEI